MLCVGQGAYASRLEQPLEDCLQQKCDVTGGGKIQTNLKSFFFKGTVSQEKLLNCGLGEMVWTLTIDRT